MKKFFLTLVLATGFVFNSNAVTNSDDSCGTGSHTITHTETDARTGVTTTVYTITATVTVCDGQVVQSIVTTTYR